MKESKYQQERTAGFYRRLQGHPVSAWSYPSLTGAPNLARFPEGMSRQHCNFTKKESWEGGENIWEIWTTTERKRRQNFKGEISSIKGLGTKTKNKNSLEMIMFKRKRNSAHIATDRQAKSNAQMICSCQSQWRPHNSRWHHPKWGADHTMQGLPHELTGSPV